VVWIQEETMNSGAFWFVEPRIARILRELDFETQNLKCHARRAIASTAIGSIQLNNLEYTQLIQTLDNYK